jgi:hypothetical protein
MAAWAVLYDLDVEEDIPGHCTIEAWVPPVPAITEVFHAHIVDWAYPQHCHDTWAVLIVDDGAIRYDLDTRPRGAARRTVTILPPGVAHDGRPAPGAAGSSASARTRTSSAAGSTPPAGNCSGAPGPRTWPPRSASATRRTHQALQAAHVDDTGQVRPQRRRARRAPSIAPWPANDPASRF